MTSLAERFAQEAERLVGTRFQLHGRDPAHGVDCVGLVLCALERAGRTAAFTSAYGLRNTRIDKHLRLAATLGLVPVEGEPLRGDVLLVRPGPAQHHLLAMLSHDRFVHAHAGLRRVVCQHGSSAWPLAGHWRFATE